MARPIEETPILFGKDAELFERRRIEVENLSDEVRNANRSKLLSDCEKAEDAIVFCW